MEEAGVDLQTTFCLLDWSSTQRAQHRVWTDPQNAHLPFSPDSFENMTPLYKPIWGKFRQSDDIYVPDGITQADILVK